MFDLSFGDVGICKPVAVIVDIVVVGVTVDVAIANTTVCTSME